jgi:adenylate cyclase class 2
MKNSEIELKFPVPDPEALQTRLPQLGFQLVTPRTFEHNTLYDTPTRDLRAKRELLRLRQYGSIWTLTHKRPGNQPADITRYKVRIETETTVEDGPALAAIFEQLGYTPAFIYEKFRTEWSHVDIATNTVAHLVIDETPIGNYAELEGSSDWIDRAARRLGIDPAQYITLSYGRLFEQWRIEHRSAVEDLTFSSIAAATR